MLASKNELEVAKGNEGRTESEQKPRNGYETPRLMQVGTLDSIQGYSGRKGDHDAGSAYAWY